MTSGREVLTALGPRWESPVAALLERVPGVTVARRCADVSELLSVAEAGLGDVVVVSWDLRGLDLDVVARLRRTGHHVVGLVPGDDEGAERRLRQLGLTLVVPLDAEVDRVGAALAGDGAVARESGAVLDGADPSSAANGYGEHGRDDGSDAGERLPGTGPVPAYAPGTPGRSATATPSTRHGSGRRRNEAALPARPARGQVVAVWGPTGAPGRTTLATTLAAELAARGAGVLLVDADTYGGCVAQALGLLDEAPGIAAACRAADHGMLDLSALARTAPEVVPGLRVLTGLPRAERWPELRAGAVERVLDVSRELVDVVVVDCGFCLEDDEELSYDTVAPRRNEATLTALAASDVVVAVGAADPVGLQRFVRGLQELGTVPSGEPVPVVNRVRAAAVGGHPEERIADSLRRFAGLDRVRFVPDEPQVIDAAVLAGRTVVEHAPESAVRRAVADLATHVAPWSVPQPRRRARGRASKRSEARLRA
jgi:MinD-like ATPase involved in chromosome partitioning or flagellar assembly